MARKPDPRTFQPTPEQLRTVEAMSGYGIPQADIAHVIGVNIDTLRKRCAKALQDGKVRAHTQVAQTLFNMATGLNGQPVNVAAAIFWSKTQMGWRERTLEERVAGGQTYVLTIER